MKRSEAMDIYKGRLEKFKNTQSIQWKMNLSIWTLLTLAIYNNNIFNNLDTCIKPIILFLISGIHLWYCILTQKSLNADKAIGDDIVEQLNEIQDEQQQIIVTLKKKGNHSNWAWVVLQTAITVILSIIFYHSLAKE